jgi:hypothetical protein
MEDRNLFVVVALSLLIVAGCGNPTPPTAVNTGPPPPPPPVVEPKPAPPPPVPQPDPFQLAVGEVSKVFQRFSAIGAEIKDEVTADKAVEEMARLNAQLKELAAQISNIPRKPSDDKHMLALRSDLAKMTTELSSPQNAQADPELQLKVLPAKLSVVSDGLLAVEQALLSRQPGVPPQSEHSQPPVKKPEN